jgi:hypothetical protein
MEISSREQKSLWTLLEAACVHITVRGSVPMPETLPAICLDTVRQSRAQMRILETHKKWFINTVHAYIQHMNTLHIHTGSAICAPGYR